MQELLLVGKSGNYPMVQEHGVWNAGPIRAVTCTKLDLGGDMKHSPPPTKSSATWKELYIAALFEQDTSKLPSRLADAQRAISTERRKLLMSARDISEVAQERQVLDNALFSLQALASCMAIPPTALSGATPEVRVS